LALNFATIDDYKNALTTIDQSINYAVKADATGIDVQEAQRSYGERSTTD
jgi:hypothetical protein